MVKFELNKEGVRELMLSPQMATALEGVAGGILAKLGEGYSTNTYRGKNRINVEVEAETIQAKQDNLANNTILKALQ